MSNFEVRNEDAFAFVKSIGNESVDLVVSSPPYFMGKEYDKSTKVEDFVEIHHRLLIATES